MVSGQKRCRPCKTCGIKVVEGDWLTLDHAGRLKFQSPLVVTGAIVIARDDDLSGTSSRSLLKYGLRVLGERQRGEPTIDDVLNESEGSDCWSVLIVGSSMMNIAKGCRTRYSCSGGSPVFGLELHLLFL